MKLRVHSMRLTVLYPFYYYSVTHFNMPEITCFVAIKNYDKKFLNVNLKCLRECMVIFDAE